MQKINPAPNNPRGLRNVLTARFTALSDVTLTVPVLYSACACYSTVHFTMITRKSMTSVFINPPENLTVIGVNLEDYKGIGGLRKLYNELRKQVGFDAFIDLQDEFSTRLLRLFCRMGGIPVSAINNGRIGKRALTRRQNKVLLPLLSYRARYRQAFHAIGLPVETRFEGFFANTPSGKGAPETFAAVTAPRQPGERWVGIAPFAKYQGKIYPTELMEEVVAALSKEQGVRVFLFGGGDSEREILDRWARDYPHVTSLAEKRLGFPVELALASHLDVMVSMDSANMHLASLVATPVVSIWGATHPYCGFKGWRQNEEDIIQLPMTCRPCSVFGNKPCFRGDYLCLRAITPASILTRIKAHLK